MIRKIVAGAFLIYLSVWLGAAYLIEHHLYKLLDHGFYAKEIKISGFPGIIKFDLIDPAITVTSKSESQVFKSDSIRMTVGLSLKKIKFELSEKWRIESKNSKKYQFVDLEFDSSPLVIIKLDKPVILTKGGLDKNFRGLTFESDNIYAYAENEELFALTDTYLYLRHMRIDDTHGLSIDTNVTYAGKSELLGFESMRFVCDGDVEYIYGSGNNKISLRGLDFENFELNINENTYLGLFGEVELSENGLPYGKFDLELQNSSELIDLLWPSSLNINNSEIKNILDQAGGRLENGDISLPITFSSSGILINGKTIEELQEE